MKNKILLIGLPGSGKTAFAKKLGEALNISYIDMDPHIEKISGKTIPELFAISEEHFRDYESKSCEIISKMDKSLIVAAGGGVVKRKKNIDLFKENGAVVIFIDRPISHIVKTIDTSYRPLLKDKVENLYRLNEERYDLYINYSDYRIDNSGSIDDTLQELKKIAEIHLKIN